MRQSIQQFAKEINSLPGFFKVPEYMKDAPQPEGYAMPTLIVRTVVDGKIRYQITNHTDGSVRYVDFMEDFNATYDVNRDLIELETSDQEDRRVLGKLRAKKIVVRLFNDQISEINDAPVWINPSATGIIIDRYGIMHEAQRAGAIAREITGSPRC